MRPMLEGKTILVAGAGGIGDELARRYAAEGAAVLIGDLDGARAEAVATGIVEGGGRAVGVCLDGADETSIKSAIDRAVAAFGGIDGAHINFVRATAGDNADLIGLPLADFDEIMRTNVRGYLLCTRHVLPALIARGGGSIVYTSSEAAYVGEPLRLAYAMSKSAMHAMMRHVASRYASHGIRANAIAAGLIWHAGLEAVLPKEMADELRARPAGAGRPGAPADIAAMGALLLSGQGAFVSGQVISVSGGATMRP